MEPVALLEVPVDRLLAQALERPGGDLRGDVGIAVAVAPHPGAEGKDGGHLDAVVGIVRLEPPAERFVDPGNGLPETGQERQAALHLVEHRGTLRAEEGGLPEDRQLAPQVGHDPLALAGEEVVAVEVAERPSHPP